MERRWNAGEPVSAQVYLEEFPDVWDADHVAAFELVINQYELLRDYGRIDSFCAKVPATLRDEIRSQLARRYPPSTPAERFQIQGEQPHAGGGLGEIFVAIDAELGREVAFKQVKRGLAGDRDLQARFLREAEITGSLVHPGVVPIYALGQTNEGLPFYAMQFIRGTSLKEAIDCFHADNTLKLDQGRRSLERRKLLRRLLEVCNTVAFAHSRGVLHRDLKPDNVMLGPYGETFVVDWGLAKLIGRAEPATAAISRLDRLTTGPGQASLAGSVRGTPAFMSPEQAGGEIDPLGPASDVYSLGATLYSLLTGRLPVESNDPGEVIHRMKRGEIPSPRSLDPTIPKPLDAICRKAMAVRPEARYCSARALADDVELWMADEPVTAWREPLSTRAQRWARRNRATVASAGVALLAGVIGLAVISSVQARHNTALAAKNADLNLANERAEREAETARSRARIGVVANNAIVSTVREDKELADPASAMRDWD